MFYAAINLGFLSPYQSQVNQGIWIGSFYRISENQKLYEEQKQLEQYRLAQKQQQDQADKSLQDSVQNKEGGKKNLTIPIVGSADSTKSVQVNSSFTNVTSGKADSSAVSKVIEVEARPAITNFKDTSQSRAYLPSFGKDSLHFKDTLAAKRDTVKIDSMAIDSTARLKYMKYSRDDYPNVQLSKEDKSGFFAKPSEGTARRVVAIDSTGKYVEIKDVVGTEDRKILLRMPLEDYINLQVALNEESIWDENFNSLYTYKGSQKELGELLKDITSFEIPLPSVGVLSIFGKPIIKLTIGGSVDIHGAWRNQTTQGVTASALGNTTNEPNFQQQVQINVNGSIGDKLSISADWNTERTFEYQNMLHIKYTGYEDEIIQSVEAGNVSMQASPLVGGSEALFGIKAQFKLGPLSLTTLASQKKGEMKEVAVNSGSQSAPFTLRAYNYATNNFFVDKIYADESLNIFSDYYNKSVAVVHPEYKIIQIQVWKSKNTVTYDPAKERKANAYLNLDSIRIQSGSTSSPTYPKEDDTLRSGYINPVSGSIATGRFVLLTEGTDYIVHYETGYITLLTTVNDNDAIAVAYSTGNNSYQYGEFINQADTSARLILKLVKPPNLLPDYKQAWSLMLKNVYSLQATNIKKDGFDLQIKYEIPGQDPVTTYNSGGKQIQLLNALGLDKYDSGGNPNPDNIFDWKPDITILPAAGEIIFPVLEPFGKEYLSSKGLDTLAFQSVYDTSYTYASQDQTHDKWSITGKYSGDATSVYSLGFNVVENSVKVTLNGKALSVGSDYTVDYNTGQLTILNSNALIPGADLKITFEQNDLFSLASKTLLGARGVFDLSEKTKLGFSILNLNEQTLSDKVRIGEEPLSNTMMGVDLSTSANLPFLTNALDKVISTKQMSTFTFAGEFAHMSPNPNTMKSTISDDGGQSVAYIDDFEGAKKIIPIGVAYTGWKDLSEPDLFTKLTPGYPSFTYNYNKNYTTSLIDYKAKSWWYSVTPSNVTIKNIWGSKKQAASTDQQVSVMDYVFQPDTPGTYNMSPSNTFHTNPAQNWGGMMKLLSSTASDLKTQNMQYIEFWLKVDKAPDSAKLYIDLGRISEDVIPNKSLDYEDRNNNGVIDAGEDIGIDHKDDNAERDSAKNYGFYTADKADPANDDFSLSNTGSSDPYNYFSINGTEGNSVLTDVGKIPDTEDLNLNGSLDMLNNYYRYQIPLDSNAAMKQNIIAGGGNTNEGWHLYRIPLQNHIDSVGSPTLSDVEYIRVFTTGVASMVHVRFAEFNLVGNQWQQVIPYDTVMAVSVINVEDNPNYYSPPGLQREQDRTITTTTVYKNEQSMDLKVKGLKAGDKREAVEYLARTLDVFSYREMKVFFHGDESGSIAGTSSGGKYNAYVTFKFGTDSNNYYEYRQPVMRRWNDADIIFSSLTAIKSERSALIAKYPAAYADTTEYKSLVAGYTDRWYGIKGSPTLTSLKFLKVIIENTSNDTVSGEVWVNELRVIGADDHAGNAYTLATSVKFADLLGINFNMSHTDPYFHSLSDRFGSRSDTKSWSIGASLDVLKLLPLNLQQGSSLSLSYTHSENVILPLYMPGTDISVDTAASKAESKKAADSIRSTSQTISTSDTWSLGNISLKIPTNYWLIRDTFNGLSFSFNYNKTFQRSPTILSNHTWVWNAGMNYSVNFSQDNYLLPERLPVIGSILGLMTDYKDVKFYFTPQSFAFTISAKRNRQYTTSRATLTTASTSIFSHDFSATRGFNFSWKFTEGGIINLGADYSATFNSSLADYETTNNGQDLAPESLIWRRIMSGNIFGKDYSLQQTVNFRTAPKLPSIWDIDKNFNLTASYSAGYQWQHNFSAVDTTNGIIKDAGKSASVQNRTQIGLRISLKSLMEPLFITQEKDQLQNIPSNLRSNNSQVNRPPQGNPPEGNPPEAPTPGNEGRQRSFNNENAKSNNEEAKKPDVNSPEIAKTAADSLMKTDTTVQVANKKSSIKNALLMLKLAVKALFFDYESVGINFSNSNTFSKAALLADGTGFSNFWGFKVSKSDGPSRLFMLGLSSDVGDRVSGLSSITDVFSQNSNVDIMTSRPLWTGAKVDLSWKLSWTMNKSTPFSTNGLPAGSITETGSISRSFFALPSAFTFGMLKTGIKQVHNLYNDKADNAAQSLSDAFIQGFETMPVLSKLSFLQSIATYIPRPNWTVSWDGLEKFFPFKGIAEKVTLDHAYSSSYTEGWYVDPNGNKVTQSQQVNYSFAPLVGLNMTFGKLWSGNLSGNIKYSTGSTYSLGMSSSTITQAATKDIGVSATYQKSGFELPLFGLTLKNDIEFTFSYTFSQTSTVLFNMDPSLYTDAGTPQDGQSRITIEPRIKYSISSKVTLSIFYTRTTVQPEGASRVEPTTSNEAGLDVHIAIGG